MCHKCHVSYSNANLGTASSLLERSAEVQLIFDKDSIFLVKSKGFYEKNLWKVEFHCCCNSSILRFHNVCSSCCLGAKKSLV